MQKFISREFYKHLFKLGIYPFLVFIINYSFSNLYLESYKLWRIDTPMHILGGLTIAYSIEYALRLAEENNLIIIRKNLMRAVIIMAGVISAAVLWEFYEFIADQFFASHHQISLFDTMKDFLMGIIGGILFCLSLNRKHKK